MLIVDEYVARPELSQALSVLGARLARHGTLLVIITRKNWITERGATRGEAAQDITGAVKALGTMPPTGSGR